jgi:hypothetical protein
LIKLLQANKKRKVYTSAVMVDSDADASDADLMEAEEDDPMEDEPPVRRFIILIFNSTD